MTNNGLGFVIALAVLGGCTQGGFAPPQGDRVFAPGVAGQSQVNQLVVGHRLMDAGEHELALAAYSRAAVQQGFNVDTLSALGSANLRLGRLNQAERLLRRAVKEDANYAPAWNNLGVLLMEQGKTTEARQIFRRAFATDNGQSDEIRDNLRLAIAKTEDPSYRGRNKEEFDLVRSGDYVL